MRWRGKKKGIEYRVTGGGNIAGKQNKNERTEKCKQRKKIRKKENRNNEEE